jgi:peptide-methionine (S)-S-oxide reductase
MSAIMKISIILAAVIAIGCGVAASSASKSDVDLSNLAPTPQRNADKTAGTDTAVFAGGCFWGVDAVFKHVKGVVDVRSGYAGGKVKSPSYEQVSTGDTGHAESVKVTYDPSQISYSQLLTIFFSVAHDPTEKNRQGPDVGTQYRSAIFYTSDEQKKTATDFIAAVQNAKVFSKPVVTEVAPLDAFYEAESYHQNYLATHTDEPYIVYNDLPKLDALKKKFPELYKK